MGLRHTITASVLLLSAELCATPLGVAGQFNAMIFGNLTASTGDTEGRLAISGNGTFTGGYAVGLGGIGPRLPNSATRDDLVVGGTLSTATNWAVIGNAAYEDGVSGPGVSHVTPGASTRQVASMTIDPLTGNAVSGTGLSFDDILEDLRTLSGFWSTMTQTAGVTVTEAFGTLTINATDPSLNVVNLTPSQWLNSIHTRNITAPAGSTLLINVGGTSVNINGGSMNLNGISRTNVITNYFDATQLAYSSFSHQGAILAAFTTSSVLKGGGVDGQGFHAGTVTQQDGWQWHNVAFTGNIPDSSQAVPEPATTGLAGLALLGVVVASRRRSKGAPEYDRE